MSKSSRILFGSLLLGIAAASVLWLLSMPRKHVVSDAEASAMSFGNAENYHRSNTLIKSIQRQRYASPQQLSEAKSLLQSPNDKTKIATLFALSRLTQPPDDAQAIPIIVSASHDASPWVRSSVVMALSKFQNPKAEQAIDALSTDASEDVRRQVTIARQNQAYLRSLPPKAGDK